MISSTLTGSPCFDARADVLRVQEALLVEERAQDLAAALSCRRLGVAGECGTAGERLQAAAHPAAAGHLPVGLDVDVPDVARRSLRAAVDATVDDDAGADPAADLDEDEVVDAATAAGRELAERHHVDVVVDPDGDVALREVLPHGVAVPAGHDRRRDGLARVELDRAGDADPDPPQRAGGAGLCDALVEERVDVREHLLRPGGDVGRLLAVDDDPAGEIGERDVGARRTEVGHEQVARVGPEAEQSRGAAAGRDAHAVLREQAEVDQDVDPLGQDRAAEPGGDGQLRARALAVRADVVQDVHEPVRRRSGAVFLLPC